jgi:hypothetical protein
MNRVLNELLLQPVPRAPFSWEVQGLSETLRPNVFDYDSVFLDVLFEQQVPMLLSDITNRELLLGHIQVVRTKPGPSYIDWHRDTHFYEGETVAGNIPPVHKVIFYPQTNGLPPEPRLKLLRGSNRTMFTNRERDFKLIEELPVDVAHSAPNQCVLFETTTFHAVVPDAAPQGSIRAIYTFMSRDQFSENYGLKALHADLLRRYEERLARNRAKAPASDRPEPLSPLAPVGTPDSHKNSPALLLS